jgi:hypothetical protein
VCLNATQIRFYFFVFFFGILFFFSFFFFSVGASLEDLLARVSATAGAADEGPTGAAEGTSPPLARGGAEDGAGSGATEGWGWTDR